MCFLLTTSSLAWTLMIICTIVYIYNCVFGSLISDVTCNYVSADGGRDGLWRPALLWHWLSYTGCWQSLLVMYWLMFGMLFPFLITSLGCFCPRTLLFEQRTEQVAMDFIFTCYTKDNQPGCFRLSNWFSLQAVRGRGWTTCLLHDSSLFGSHFKSWYVSLEWDFIYLLLFLAWFTVSCMKLWFFSQ